MQKEDRVLETPDDHYKQFQTEKWALNKVPLIRAKVIEGPVTKQDVWDFVEAAKLMRESPYGQFIYTTLDGSLWPNKDMDSITRLKVVHRDFHRLEPGRYIPAVDDTWRVILWGYSLDDWGSWPLRNNVEKYVKARGLDLLPNACGVDDVEFYESGFLD